MEQREAPPFCVNCDHVVAGLLPEHHKCANTVSMVDGGPRYFCVHEREDRPGRCGPSAVYFKPRAKTHTSLFSRIISILAEGK